MAVGMIKFNQNINARQIMKSKIIASAFALLLSLTMGAYAQEAPVNLGIPVDLLEEVRDSFIFVFTDDVPASEVSGRMHWRERMAGGSRMSTQQHSKASQPKCPETQQRAWPHKIPVSPIMSRTQSPSLFPSPLGLAVAGARKVRHAVLR